MRKLLAIAVMVLGLSGAWANEAQRLTDDPVLEARVQALAEVLRCLVCQNQTLADSHADLAIDLKNQVREMLRQGRSEKEVVDYLVQRYGDFVLYNPPLKGTTWLLWLGPFGLLVGGIGGLFWVLKRRRQRNAAAPLSQAEREAAARLLEG